MTRSAIVVDAPPDPVAIAQRFAGRAGFAFLHGASDGEYGQRSFIAVDPIESSSAMLPGQPGERGGAPGDTRGDVPRWIGVIPYECGRSLERLAWTRTPDEREAPHFMAPVWNRYGAVIDVDPVRGVVRVVGDDARKVAELASELRAGPVVRRARAPVRLEVLPNDDPPEAHLERIRRAKELIAAGDLYQVNLARRERLRAVGAPLDLYLAIAEQAPSAFGACLALGGAVVCASSPELFLDVDVVAGRARTAPIKGTRPRGTDAASDAQLAAELDQSDKERAELTMILDVERNDLGRVCAPGTVRLQVPPRVDPHPTIHHRAAVLGGILRSGVTSHEVLEAMFPSGSVTGAPKVRAMEVIADLEPVRRGLYTGAFGYVTNDGSLRLAMAIRVLTIKGGEAHYYAGGGIVADSDPAAELAETRWKAAQIERLTGAVAAGPSVSQGGARRRPVGTGGESAVLVPEKLAAVRDYEEKREGK
ncbi:MAG: anthranilate synthase component I family protein [Polyangiaceae bacterium]